MDYFPKTQHILSHFIPCLFLPVLKDEMFCYPCEKLFTHCIYTPSPSCLSHLLGSSRLSLEDCFCCFVVLMSHGASKRRRALTVSQVQTDVWVRDKKLDNHTVLVTDGHMDWRPALGILHVRAEQEHHQRELITMYTVL